MIKNVPLSAILLLICVKMHVDGCLITNCPKGGKRSKMFSMVESNIKTCISCGPEHTGQCFGPNICCGPFGCLVGSAETTRCQIEGMFHETEPCMAGFSACRKNTGRCALENICCTRDSCHTDIQCSSEGGMTSFSERGMGMELYQPINNNSPDLFIEK